MIFASNNIGKIKEIKTILDEYEIYSLKECNIKIDIIEDEDSFYGNALKKASEINKITNKPVIADDSGLCIDALNNWPGVETQRFLGENKTDKEKNTYILERLKKIKNLPRTAHAVCCLVYFDGKNMVIGEGVIHGTIALKRRGTNGIGFDEIFELENGKTLAELSKDEKKKISPIYLATIDLKNKLKEKNIL